MQAPNDEAQPPPPLTVPQEDQTHIPELAALSEEARRQRLNVSR